MLQKIISGGQSGVDRAALDVALELGLPCGGWCPKGRKAEDGPLPARYPLKETPSDDYAQRTRWNVRDSDGTLVLMRRTPTEGTAFTIDTAARLTRPCLIIDLTQSPAATEVQTWIRLQTIQILNVAGPRESGQAGIYLEAARFLRLVLSSLATTATGASGT